MILRFALGHFPTSSHVCHSSLVHSDQTSQQNVIVPPIKWIKKQWQLHSQDNLGNDTASQTFYFAFLSIMNIPQARNILQIGCGFGNLIPLAIMLKKQQAIYLATDLVQNMIETTKKNMKQNFAKYESKLTFQQWCQKNHLLFKAANGEEIISTGRKFDRIICNCVLQITENPTKMLQSFYDEAEPGCLLGISVWGDENKNPILKFIMQIIKEEGGESSRMRSEFHLYKKVSQMAEKIGWKLVLQWQQNALIPISELNFEGKSFQKSMVYFVNLLPEQKRNSARKRIVQKAYQLIKNKQGLSFSTQLYLFKKM